MAHTLSPVQLPLQLPLPEPLSPLPPPLPEEPPGVAVLDLWGSDDVLTEWGVRDTYPRHEDRR